MTTTDSRLTTHQVQDALGKRRLQIVDVRPIDAYNGWRLQNEPRGGHIPGARTLPFKWSSYIDWIEIVRSKGITPRRPVLVYGYEQEATESVADLFRRAGYEEVFVFHDFVNEWAAAEGPPIERLPRHRHVVPAEWVRSIVAGEESAETADREITDHEAVDHEVVLCHVHYRNPADYAKGHIPGSISLDTLILESPETWNRRSPAEVRSALRKLGITAGTTVVLYGRFSFPDNADPFPGSSAGQLAAFRCAFIMLWAGVEDVRVLNGGMQSWLDAGYEVTTDPTEGSPAADFGAEVPGAPELAVDLSEARRMLVSSEANLVSVRSRREYIGEVSGYNYIERKGRIPGSVFGNCGSDAYHMENYRNLDHTTREYGEIVDAWRAAGITADAHNAFYCGTGWRGSEAFFNAWLLGWPRVSVYDGGWFEWSSDPSNPIETGEPSVSTA